MKTFTPVLFTVLLVGLIRVNGFSQTDQELKQAIEGINKELAKSMLEGDFSKSLKYYSNDAITMPNNAKMVQGIDEIKKSNETMIQSGIKMKTFEANTLQVKSCGNLVTEIGTYKLSMIIPGVPGDYEDFGKYLTIWEKQADGSLKIKIEMWNTDVSPVPGTM
jgi:ketosteroid isomerase-like protein